jgi:alpha-amylase/alpha-mannosidase (GH57 family)
VAPEPEVVPTPLLVSFVWHMHQPFYQDTRTGEYLLPWVRLHAVKDYLHLARIAADYPTVHQTLNVVPSLAIQLEAYARGEAVDRAQAISAKLAVDGATLTVDDKSYLLKEFFSINWDHFVYPNPRFRLLARLREAANGETSLLSDQYWRDLAVWYNLAWIDPSLRQRDARLRRLFEKGGDYGSADVASVLAAHRDLIAQILPTYRALADAGQLELTTSPFYHPILPLLLDTACAREASPALPLPHLRFSCPEDAATQVADALEYHERAFGQVPSGMWPSEGAVSQAAIELLARYPAIRWIATDEHVLERALGYGFERDANGQLKDPRPLYQPYYSAAGGPALFFRDQVLSDRVGFVYQHWDSRDAANDLVERLLQARRTLGDPGEVAPPIVSIVLDGENCWEHYPNNGDDFLRALFDRLSREPGLRAITPAEYLQLYPAVGEQAPRLANLPAASWIGSNLETWIGEPDQNRAWEFVALARHRLTKWEREHGDAEPQRRQQARRAMHVAEGSDWFWWYYSRNRVGGAETFDVQFRTQLANVYRALDLAVPEWLNRPVTGQAVVRLRQPTGPITPPLTGELDSLAGWADAGFVDPQYSSGTMQVGAHALRRLYFGSDVSNLYFRLELTAPTRDGQLSIFVGGATDSAASHILETVVPRSEYAIRSGQTLNKEARGLLDGLDWRVDVPAGRDALVWQRIDGVWRQTEVPVVAAVGELSLEVGIGRAALGLATADRARASAGLLRDELVVELVPTGASVEFPLETESR